MEISTLLAQAQSKSLISMLRLETVQKHRWGKTLIIHHLAIKPPCTPHYHNQGFSIEIHAPSMHHLEVLECYRAYRHPFSGTQRSLQLSDLICAWAPLDPSAFDLGYIYHEESKHTPEQHKKT